LPAISLYLSANILLKEQIPMVLVLSQLKLSTHLWDSPLPLRILLVPEDELHDLQKKLRPSSIFSLLLLPLVAGYSLFSIPPFLLLLLFFTSNSQQFMGYQVRICLSSFFFFSFNLHPSLSLHLPILGQAGRLFFLSCYNSFTCYYLVDLSPSISIVTFSFYSRFLSHHLFSAFSTCQTL
jgi:hypothetical protein